MKRLVSVLAGILVAGSLPCPASAAASAESSVESGSFSVLSYNIAGLPEPLSGSDPDENTRPIGQRVNAYDIVNVQEDFNYHADLYDTDEHPYRTPTSGIAGLGDGLNTMSRFPIQDLERRDWDDCSGTDCLTPKGFSWLRVRLADGVYVDLYNIHANAGTSSDDDTSRRRNIAQMSSYITSNSQGNAVIVMGDTNARYYRTGDNIRLLASANGLTDAWVQTRGGEPPAQGGPAPACDRTVDPNPCEEVDKIFYRSNRYIQLQLDGFQNEHDAFLRPDGGRLSDHDPVAAWFSWSTDPQLGFSNVWGGPHGGPFTDVDSVLIDEPVRAISIRSGKRLDQIGITLGDGTRLTHGGNGGGASQLTLAPGEYFDRITLWAGKYDTTRIFRIEVHTNEGRVLAGGNATNSSVTYTAPSGFMIGGFHGRSGQEVDRLGVIYTPIDVS